MLYELVIVDDEPIIRECMREMFDWEELGYRVAATFDDGKAAIEYIGDHPVDLVITDIKMIFASGLDVAEYIHTNRLDIKVVLMSAYEDFEYARRAISYGVVHYILKPMNIGEVKEVVLKVKEQLDNKYRVLEERKDERRHMDYVVPLVQKQLLQDVVVGGLRDYALIRSRMKLTGMYGDPEHSLCCMGTLWAKQYQLFLEKDITYTKETFYQIFLSFVNNQTDKNTPLSEGHFYVMEHNGANIRFVFISSLGIEAENVIPYAKRLLGQVREEIFRSYELETVADFEQRTDLLTRLRIPELPDEKEKNVNQMISGNRLIQEKERLLASYLTSGNKQGAANLFGDMMEGFAEYRVEITQNFMIDLFSGLNVLLKDTGTDIIGNENIGFSYREVVQLNAYTALLEYGREILERTAECMEESHKSSSIQIIRKAKEYISQHACEDITLEDVSSSIYLNPVYFSKLFKSQTGENFSDYLIAQRIQRAKELLRDETYKVYEISSMVGYKSVQYFYRIFKQHTGVTPLEYRNNMIPGSEE